MRRHKHTTLQEISKLEPERHHEQIVLLSSAFDFPWDTQRALELALVRTFAIPKSSALLVATREFTERTQKRYDDTVAIISALGFYGYSSNTGKRALRRMNQIHGHYTIPNDEFLYVLSTFVLEPLRWNERYGWRRLSDIERQATFVFWQEVGKRMNISDIPASLADLDAFNRAYEAEHFAFHPNNRILADATEELFVSWFLPRGATWPRWLARETVHCLMDAPMRDAFGYDDPPAWLQRLIAGGLQARKRLWRYLPARQTPYMLPPLRSYPEGYALEQLGPTVSVTPHQETPPFGGK